MVMTVMYIAICMVVGYFFGTISTAYLVGKRNNIDIREFGSKNAGTTNAMRTLGKKAGAIVFLGDCIKAVVPMLIMMLLLGKYMDIETIKLATGFGAVLGHNFPFWLGFKGGNGIAVTSTVIIVFSLPQDWLCPSICLLLFIAICLTTKYVSLGSLVVVTTFLVYVATNFTTHEQYLRILVLTLLFVLLAFYMHRANIVRLLKGTENKIGSKKVAQQLKEVQNQQGMNNPKENNQEMNQQRMNQQGMNQQRMNQQEMNIQNANNNQGLNNQRYNQNQVFLDPSDLVDTNISDFTNDSNDSNKYNGDDRTEQLYNTQFFDVVNNNMRNGNTNEFNVQSGNNTYYKGYNSCDTLDETRQLDEEELFSEANEMLNATKSYYNDNN